jgi:hypothetical protein
MNNNMNYYKNAAFFNGMLADDVAAPALRSTEEYGMVQNTAGDNETLGMKIMRALSAMEIAIVSFIHSNRSGDEFFAFAPSMKVEHNHDAMRWFDGNADMQFAAPCGLV